MQDNFVIVGVPLHLFDNVGVLDEGDLEDLKTNL